MAVVWEVHYFLSEVIDMAAGDAESKRKMTSSSMVSPGGGTGGREAGTCKDK